MEKYFWHVVTDLGVLKLMTGWFCKVVAYSRNKLRLEVLQFPFYVCESSSWQNWKATIAKTSTPLKGTFFVTKHKSSKSIFKLNHIFARFDLYIYIYIYIYILEVIEYLITET